MIPKELLGLIQQPPLILCSGGSIPPPQLRQNFLPCLLAHGFVHSGQGNSHFWRNESFCPSSPPLPGNKTFGAIRSVPGGCEAVAFRVAACHAARPASPCRIT